MSLETEGDFGWHQVEENKLHEIRKKMADFERLTWKEIFQNDNQGSHRVSISQLSKEAQERFREKFGARAEEIEDLVSLRLNSRERIWGIWNLGVVEVIWWDPTHQICPSLKKNT